MKRAVGILVAMALPVVLSVLGFARPASAHVTVDWTANSAATAIKRSRAGLREPSETGRTMTDLP